MNKKNRIWEIDFLRGLAVILMILEHFVFNIYYFGYPLKVSENTLVKGLFSLFDISKSYLFGNVRIFLRYTLMANMFFLLAGISCSFSRNLKKRSLKILACAFSITLITVVASLISDQFSSFVILFGVLHALGFSMLIFAFMPKLSSLMLIVIGAILFALGLFLSENNFQINNILLLPFGIAKQSLSPGDYYPLIPWIGTFFIGAAIGKMIYKEKKSIFKFRTVLTNPIEFIGRYSLVIYISHQVILFAFFYLITV